MTTISRAPERVIEYPGAPRSVEAQILDHMIAQLGRRDCVYFVGFHKWVKIGTSSQILTRLEMLDCLPEPVTLLALVPGDRQDEDALHVRFSKYHTHAEWFLNEGKLAAYIQTLRDRTEKALR